ncbi:MAG: thiolase family protein [Longimicrobiales bacterium]
MIDAVRTPVGRHGGALARVRLDDLAAHAIRALVQRTGIDTAQIDDVILGCANQAGEDNRNVARMALLLADLPVLVPGQTVNRLCGSGLQAINSGFHAISAGEGDIFITGGVESMTRAPYVMLKADEAFARGIPEIADTMLGWRFVNPRFPDNYTIALGLTAEAVATRYGVSREAQDAFALQSQQRAGAAMSAGRFDDEMVSVSIPSRKETLVVDRDEHPRPDTTAAQLAKLKPAFKTDGGTVTAGNSSGINDGASAVLLASAGAVAARGLKPVARIVSSAVAGVEPDYMGMGPVPASLLALKRAGLKASDLKLVELNEAFAAQALPCMTELQLDPAIVNVNGGAIALGHALGNSGSRMMTTLVHELRRRGGGYGLVSMCIGVGQGIATIVEVQA